MSQVPLYPQSEGWFIRLLRFLNLLDDAVNKLSPVKFNLWSANIAGAGTVLIGVLAWVGHHADLLNKVLSIGPVVGGYITHAHMFHQADKRNKSRGDV